jgi:predicted metalloendopeptidase
VTNARRLYRSCIDEANIEIEGVDPVLSLINKEFGGWPILHGLAWNSSTFDFSNLLLKLRQYNYNIIYKINTETDEKNSSATDIVVSEKHRLIK